MISASLIKLRTGVWNTLPTHLFFGGHGSPAICVSELPLDQEILFKLESPQQRWWSKQVDNLLGRLPKIGQ